MSELYVKAWFLWVVVVVLIIVASISIFSYINTIEYQNDANNLKTFLKSERENHNETKESFKNVIYTLNQTTLLLNKDESKETKFSQRCR